MHVRVGHAPTDCSDQLGEFAGGDALCRRESCHIGSRQGPSDGPRLRAGRCVAGWVRIERSLAQEDHDAPSDTPLAEMDVGLPDTPLEAGIIQCVGDRGATLTDFHSELATRPSGGRRHLVKPLQGGLEIHAMILLTLHWTWDQDTHCNEKRSKDRYTTPQSRVCHDETHN